MHLVTLPHPNLWEVADSAVPSGELVIVNAISLCIIYPRTCCRCTESRVKYQPCEESSLGAQESSSARDDPRDIGVCFVSVAWVSLTWWWVASPGPTGFETVPPWGSTAADEKWIARRRRRSGLMQKKWPL